MKSSLCLIWSVLVGLFLLTSNAEAARATTLILGKSKPEPKIDTPPTAEEEAVVSASPDSQLGNETASAGNVTKLTGVPQIDYIYDPNLPRELNGYNLTDYPFYNSIPEDIDFKCDGLHDGFYASVPHKCQVYHHCLFGTRYDFLCANYTAFDQKTFICHFASEVDCKNSPKYFKRNEALYKTQSTTTLAPVVPAVLTRRPPEGGRRRRPGNRRRKPVYDYYDDYEDPGEQDYYDDGPPGRKRKRPRPHNRDNFDTSEEKEEEDDKQIPSAPNKSLYDRPRIAPKIRRPVPANEREKYDYASDSRAILAKEPVVEKTRYENRESENRKSNHRPDYHDSSPQGNSKNKESDDKTGEREKETSRDEYDRDRDRDRERDRDRPRDKNHGRDDYESDRERDRSRDSDRDDYDSDRERDRDRDRPRDRDRDDRPYRRPPKKRRRPDEDDDYEYEEVRRYRNRNRPRYDEYDDDYDYDDRPYRPRIRDSDYRSREHDYDRDKGYRNRDPEYDRPRNRDRNRDDKPVRNRDIESRPVTREEKPVRNRDEDRPVRNREDEDRPVRNREDERPYRTRDSDDEYRVDEDRQGRPKSKPPPYRGEVKNSDKNTRTRDRDSDRYYSEAESKKSVVREDYDDEPDSGRTSDSDQKSQKVPNESKTRLVARPETEKNGKPSEESRNRESAYEEPLRTTERTYRSRGSTDRIVRVQPTVDPVPEEDKVKPEEPDVVIPRFGNTRTPERTQFRGRTGTIQKLKVPYLEKEPEAPIPEEEKHIRPILVRGEAKPQSEQGGVVRKPTIPKRVHFARPPTTESPVEASNKRHGPPLAEQKFPQQAPQPIQPENLRPRPDVPRPREPIRADPEPEEPVQKSVPETPPATRKPEASSEAPKFKVPFEEQDSEELAPQAPKYFQSSNRRRPFLPSRGGNPNLPRGLLPVGNKALPIPRGFQKSDKTDEAEPKPPQSAPQSPPQIEFRAKLTTAIGVQQPKLTSAIYDDDPVEATEPETDQNYYRNRDTGQQDYRDYYDEFRPLIINPQQSRNGHDSYNSQPEKEAPVRGNYQSAEEAASTEVKDSLQHRPQLIPYSQPKNPIVVPGLNQQFGPQTFYSDNPKFKTTVMIPERFVQKPTVSTLNYHTATHLPIYHPGLQSSYGVNSRPEASQKDYVEKGSDNHKPLIIKFPPPEKENLDDTDEYDVSLNDALQPISTLHPRNAPTGVFLSNPPRVPQTNGFKRRNQQAPHVYQDQGEFPERHQVLKRVRIETRGAPHIKKPLVPRPDASNLQQRYALPPSVYRNMKPNTNFFAILS